MNFFDLVAPFYEKIVIGAKKPFSIFNKETIFEKTDTILDLGGGSGRVAKFLPNLVKEIIVADSSFQMIERCKKHQGLKCVLTQAENLPFFNAYFDKIIMVDAFHHFQNQDQVLKEIRRVLRTGGKVLIHEYNPERFFGGLIAKAEDILKLNSLFYNPDHLEKLFQKYNFKTKLINSNKSTYYLICEKYE